MLVVAKLDRLARSVPDARGIVDELTNRGVKLNLGGSVHDPTDPVGRLLFNVLAMVTREGTRKRAAGCSQSGTAPSARPSPTRSCTPLSSLPVSHPNRHDLPWLRSARWFFLATTSLTLSGLTIALQDGPAPTSGAENGQHGPSWLTVLVVNPVRLA